MPVGTIISFGGNISALQTKLGYGDRNTSTTLLYNQGNTSISAAIGKNTPSANWLLCNGTYPPVSTYPILYEVLKDSWGNETLGEDIEKYGRFKLPNLQQQYLIGSNGNNLRVRSKY